MQESIYKQ